MKHKFIIIIAVLTLTSFLLAGYFAKISGDEKVTAYFSDIANRLGAQNINGPQKEQVVSAIGLREVELLTTGINISLEKSPDQNIHYFNSLPVESNKQITESRDSESLKIDFTIMENSDGKMNIDFFKSNFFVSVQKSGVRVQIPSNIKRIKVKTVSGDFVVKQIEADLFDIISVSGDLELSDSAFNRVESVSVSGDVGLTGRVKSINFKTISGNLDFESQISNPHINFNSISGDAIVDFSQQPNAQVLFDSTSGRLDLEENLKSAIIEGDTQSYKLGNGDAQMKFFTTSGDVQISLENSIE